MLVDSHLLRLPQQRVFARSAECQPHISLSLSLPPPPLPPPKMPMYPPPKVLKWTLWCVIEGHNCPTFVRIRSTKCIAELKEEIKKKATPTLDKFAAMDLILWKVHYV